MTEIPAIFKYLQFSKLAEVHNEVSLYNRFM